ncbi:MAG: hypothetical protein KC457_37655, partial [Myxococcales bacterium]|nr:hypothetical protein [Myxococcales bacterium]
LWWRGTLWLLTKHRGDRKTKLYRFPELGADSKQVVLELVDDFDLGASLSDDASAYPGMGRELGLLFPEIVDEIGGEFASLQECVGWIYGDPRHEPTPAEKLWASSYLIQLHAKLTQKLLGLRPQAAIGYCAGESNALFALGAWQDFDFFV